MNIFNQTLEKMRHQQQVLAILVFTFVAIIFWVGVSLFTSQQKTGVSNDLLRLAKPLTPTINQEVVQRLREQGVFFDSQLQDFPIYMIMKDKNHVEQMVEIGTEPEPEVEVETPQLQEDQTPSDLTE